MSIGGILGVSGPPEAIIRRFLLRLHKHTDMMPNVRVTTPPTTPATMGTVGLCEDGRRVVVGWEGAASDEAVSEDTVDREDEMMDVDAMTSSGLVQRKSNGLEEYLALDGDC